MCETLQTITTDPVQKAGEGRGVQEKLQEEIDFCEKVTGKAAASPLLFESAQRESSISGLNKNGGSFREEQCLLCVWSRLFTSPL